MLAHHPSGMREDETMLKYWIYDERKEQGKELTNRLLGLKVKEVRVLEYPKEFIIAFEDGTEFSIENWNHEEPTQWEVK
jgi:hypothetical protein